MGSLSPSTARRESCDSKQSPSAQLFVPQRLDHLKPNGAAGGKNGGADCDCHGRDETAQDMPYSVRCPAATARAKIAGDSPGHCHLSDQAVGAETSPSQHGCGHAPSSASAQPPI